MNKINKVLMHKYGITAVTRTTYTYRDQHYDHLQDAIKYADTDIGQNKPRKLVSWSEI